MFHSGGRPGCWSCRVPRAAQLELSLGPETASVAGPSLPQAAARGFTSCDATSDQQRVADGSKWELRRIRLNLKLRQISLQLSKWHTHSDRDGPTSRQVKLAPTGSVASRLRRMPSVRPARLSRCLNTATSHPKPMLWPPSAKKGRIEGKAARGPSPWPAARPCAACPHRQCQSQGRRGGDSSSER